MPQTEPFSVSEATARPWSISPIASEGMYANDGGLAVLNEDKRVCVVDCQIEYKRGQGYLAKCAERDANAALIVKCVNSHEVLVKALEDSEAALGKVIAWLERLATHADSKIDGERFITLREAYVADAKNYRATAANIEPALAAARAALTGAK